MSDQSCSHYAVRIDPEKHEICVTWTLAGPAEEKSIDHVFFQKESKWTVIECEAIDEPIASDHLPVLAILQWSENSEDSK